ncbi:MAG TPA: hypothetical protein DCP41_02485 [Deltaproteobacteria bacterium]|nr:hypothetical protein [Deltaproteobacteria bacterium]
MAVALVPGRKRGCIMSLLQDALRKAQRFGGSSSPPPLSPHPGGSPGKPGTRWKLLAWILAAAFAVGVAGVLFLMRRTGSPPVVPPAPPAARAIPSPEPSPTPSPSGAASQPPGASPAVPPAASVSDTAPVQPTAKAGSSRVRRARGGAARTSSPPSVPTAGSMAAGGSAPATPTETPAAPAAASGAGRDPVLEKFNSGVAALNRGKEEEASLLLREVTASSPGLVEGWNALGIALLRQGRLDDADGAFSRVLSLSPRYSPGLLNIGLLRLAQGRIEEGAAYFSRAAELSPGSLAPRVNLAVAQARAGRFGEAEETLLAAGRRFPGHPDVLYHLGTVYDRIGNRARGIEAYTAFLAASAGSRPLMEDRVRARLRAWGESP